MIQVLTLYDEDLEIELEFKSVEKIIDKIKEMILNLIESEALIEEKEFIIEETNKLLVQYETEKVRKESFLDYNYDTNDEMI